MFKVERLSKTIRGKKILNDLNFEIGHGQIAIFLGESGAGKSTLLRVLNRLESSDSGSFHLDGQAARSVGMVFQHFNLFEHLSAEENIVLTLVRAKGMDKKKAKEIAERLLASYGLQDRAAAKISQLSGGQKQRLAIARTLALDPKIVCLDEPTSALDPRLTGQVAAYIADLAAERRIVLVATHDLHLLQHLDGQIFLMEGGSIAESASKQQWLSAPAFYPKIQKFLHPGQFP